MDAERKPDKTSGTASKAESAVRGGKPPSAAPPSGTPAYAAPTDPMHMPPGMAMPSPMMPYYGQYAAMYAMPPGSAPMGFPMQPPPAGAAPPMWVPGMVPAPQSGSAGQPLAAQPYPTHYPAGAQPVMYMPMPYSYPPYMQAPAPAPMGAPPAAQPAKAPAAQGATPPYNPAAPSPHPHPVAAEPVMLSPKSAPAPPSPSATAAATTAAAAAAVAVPPAPAVTPIEFSVMPLMPNTRLPPGDPFCPAGVTVSPQYAVSELPARTSAVPDRALTNGIHRPATAASPAQSTASKSEVTSPLVAAAAVASAS